MKLEKLVGPYPYQKGRTPRHQGRGSMLPLLSGIRHRPVMVSGQRE